MRILEIRQIYASKHYYLHEVTFKTFWGKVKTRTCRTKKVLGHKFRAEYVATGNTVPYAVYNAIWQMIECDQEVLKVK